MSRPLCYKYEQKQTMGTTRGCRCGNNRFGAGFEAIAKALKRSLSNFDAHRNYNIIGGFCMASQCF
jgi:hypothetical protein